MQFSLMMFAVLVAYQMACIRLVCVSWLGSVHCKQLERFFFLVPKAGYPLVVGSVPGLTQQPKYNSTYSLCTKQNKFLIVV